MKYIHSPYNDAFLNMALEEIVFTQLPKNDYCMLWQNKNAVVVGRYQNTAGEVNGEYVKKNQVQVVRRLSGGGAMYQDMGNINFTFISGAQEGKSIAFARFMAPVVSCLLALGLPVQQGGRNDILLDGKKISGNAQYIKNGRVMHHGTLLFSSGLDVIPLALTPSAEKIASRAVASVRSGVTNIAPHLPQPMGIQQFMAQLVQGLFSAGNLQEYTLSPRQLAATGKLAQEKYATWQWTWGNSPPASMQKSHRYAFGTVQLWLASAGGRVQALRIMGDFFGNANISELEAALKGCPLQERAVLAALEQLNVAEYIHGFSAAGLAQLLLC